MEHTENAITLRGQLTGLPEFSHENHGKRFCRFLLEVRRLSRGGGPCCPVVAEEALVHALDPSAGDMIAVTGQIRSHNRRENGVRRLMIFVFATQVNVESGEAINDLDLTGILCREPVYRRTPLGREICDVMLAVPGPFTGRITFPVFSGAAWLRRPGPPRPGPFIHPWAAPKPHIHKADPRRSHGADRLRGLRTGSLVPGAGRINFSSREAAPAASKATQSLPRSPAPFHATHAPALLCGGAFLFPGGVV